MPSTRVTFADELEHPSSGHVHLSSQEGIQQVSLIAEISMSGTSVPDALLRVIHDQAVL